LGHVYVLVHLGMADQGLAR